MTYYLCGSGGGGSGREAVIRGTCALLPEQPELITPCLEDDWGCGLAKLAALTRQEPNDDWLDQVKEGDVCLAMTDGNSRRLGALAHKLRRKGATVAAWNWSLGQQPLDRAAVAALRRCNAVAVRDAASFSALRHRGLHRNVRLCADPAFLVDAIPVPLPDALAGQRVVGLTLHHGAASERMMDSFRRLISHILKETHLCIALIPFGTRDAKVMRCLYAPYERSCRVCLLPMADCRVLKGYISKCSLYVSTCEDALIAAWSCAVPALAVGETQAPAAVATELLGAHNNCLLSRARQPEALILAFLRLWRTARPVRQQLEAAIPAYRDRTEAARSLLQGLRC